MRHNPTRRARGEKHRARRPDHPTSEDHGEAKTLNPEQPFWEIPSSLDQESYLVRQAKSLWCGSVLSGASLSAGSVDATKNLLPPHHKKMLTWLYVKGQSPAEGRENRLRGVDGRLPLLNVMVVRSSSFVRSTTMVLRDSKLWGTIRESQTRLCWARKNLSTKARDGALRDTCTSVPVG